MIQRQPPVWSASELESACRASIAAFRRERVSEPLEQYLEYYQQSREAIETILELTVDLLRVRDHAVDTLANLDLVDTVRYLASPPISKDDLETIAEVTLAPTLLEKEPGRAAKLLDVVLQGLDRERFPWLGEDREATEAERETAIVSTAAMRAFRRVETSRRTEGKKSQEQRVADFLSDQMGYVQVVPNLIPNLSKAPEPGQFCGETKVASRKADICIRLWDGRVMPLECKVSNSSTNSYKRINNDAAIKAKSWRDELGSVNVVPAAVLSGVFTRANLEYAQDKGLALFWSHDLSPLAQFIDSTSVK
jgi:hypothetical protein